MANTTNDSKYVFRSGATRLAIGDYIHDRDYWISQGGSPQLSLGDMLQSLFPGQSIQDAQFAYFKQYSESPIVVASNPLFEDLFDSTNTTLSTRTGWTPTGDVTKRDKMKSADGMARMNTGTNGESPWGYATCAGTVGQYRRVTFGYDYSQQGGTLTNSATPYQYYDQRWILAYQGIADYVFASAFSISGGTMQIRIYRTVAGVDTEICRYIGIPSTGTAVFELTDRIRLYVNGLIRVADQLYTDGQAAFPDKLFSGSTTNTMRSGATALRHTFYPLVLALDWKVEDLDMTVADPKPFYGRDSTNKRTITFTGTYSGTPTAWVYRLRRRTTSSVTKDWTTFTPTYGSGTWSGNITVDSGGPYVMDVGWTDGSGKTHLTVSSPFAVGILVAMWGQSNSVGGSGIGGAPGYGGNDLVIGFNGYATYVGSTFRRWVDDLTPQALALNPNMVGLAKSLSDATGIPVGVAATGVASNALATLKPGTTNWNNVLVPFITELGGNVEQWVYSGSEAEGLSSSDYSALVTDFGLTVAGFRDIGGISDAMVFIRIIGKDTSVANNSTTITRVQDVRSILKNLENGVDIWVGCSSVGLALVDQIHFTSAAVVAWCRRMGMTIARRAYSALAYDGRGPLVTGATRSSAVITLAIDLNGASEISGSTLTGYAVSNDDFVTTLTISSTEVVANQVVITLSGVPTGTVKVRSFREPNYTDSSVAVGAYPGSVTIPVFPIIDPITVT